MSTEKCINMAKNSQINEISKFSILAQKITLY